MYLQLLYKRWYTIQKPDLRSKWYYQLHEGEKRRAWKIVTNQSPQLFDIDGNACRHSHNKVKQFCKPFECFDIHWDIMSFWHTGILSILSFWHNDILAFWVHWKKFVLYWMYHLENLLREEAIVGFLFLIAFPLIWLW